MIDFETQAIRFWIGKRFGVTFSIQIKQSAAKELKRVGEKDRMRIVTVIDRLAENPFIGAALKGDLKGLRRLRTGDHRILYEIRDDELVVLVIRIYHRREVYRKRK